MRTDTDDTRTRTFTISRTAMWAAWQAGRLCWDNEMMAPTITDPDAFTPHGGEHAIDRWADDGGRAP